MVYTNHLVGFLDILGFSEICKKSENDSAERERIKSLFNLCKRIPKEFEKANGKNEIKTIVISDSIVIALKQKRDKITVSEIASFLLTAGMYQYHLSKQNVWIRGAISHGKLNFDLNEKQVFGPALVRAIELEKKSAKFPRIIVDPLLMQKSGITLATEFRKQVNDFCKANNQRVLFEWQHHFSNLSERKLPQDVPFFIDFLRNADGIKSLANIAESVSLGLNGEIEYYDKYRWLADYTLATINQIYMGITPSAKIYKTLLG